MWGKLGYNQVQWGCQHGSGNQQTLPHIFPWTLPTLPCVTISFVCCILLHWSTFQEQLGNSYPSYPRMPTYHGRAPCNATANHSTAPCHRESLKNLRTMRSEATVLRQLRMSTIVCTGDSWYIADTVCEYGHGECQLQNVENTWECQLHPVHVWAKSGSTGTQHWLDNAMLGKHPCWFSPDIKNDL